MTIPMTRRRGGSGARRWWPAALLFPLAAHAPPLSAQTSLTLYNDGRTLVRWTVPLDIVKGQTQQTAVTGPADPGSVFSLDPDVTIVSGTYDAGVDEQSVLRRAVGRRLTFRLGKDTLSATVLGVDPVRYQLADGTIAFSSPGVPQYPADLVTVDPRYDMTIRSTRSRKGLPLGYFTSGAAWSASYQVILGAAGTARVIGQAVVNSGPLRFREAEIQLLAGQVSAVLGPLEYGLRQEAMAVGRMARADVASPPVEQKVGEFHLYTLPGRWSLEPGIVRTIGLFEPADTRVTKSFEVRGRLPYWGGLPQYGDEEEVPVSVFYTVVRPRKSDLGGRPLPGGVVRLFEPDSAGRAQLIGEARIDHSPAGEDLRLNAGTSFDITAKRVQTSYSTRRDSTGQRGVWRTLATADYRVTLTNAGDSAATVDVIEERGGEWSVISSSHKPEKLSSTRTRFRMPVPAGGDATLTYRVRVIW
jgi:hypothetical protein